MADEKDEKEKAGGLPVPTPGDAAPPLPGAGSATPSGALPDKMPDLPSFRPGATDAGKKAAGGLGLFGRASGGNPAMKLRGLANSASLIDRLKQLRKKDLIFIASGLSVLMLAPLAEHFVLGPGEDANVLKQGFDSKNGVFTEANPYETGTGMATGNLPGQSSDIITPLNVRDPMSLIFGAGASQQPAASAGAGGAGLGTGGASKEGWKDAISEASRAGARTAIESGGLPTPKGNLAGSLRGLSALSGSSYGGGPSFNLGPLAAAPSKGGAGSNMAPVSAAAGYKGPAARSNSSASSLDALKAAADRAGNMFNNRGSAADNLQKAAQEAIPTGGSGSGEGGPGKGQDGKGPGGNTSKDTKTMGESLAFLRAKMEMEKAVDLKWKKIEWETFGRQKMIQEEMIKMGFDILKKGVAGPFTKAIAKLFSQALGVKDRCYVCSQSVGGLPAGTTFCASQCEGDESKGANQICQMIPMIEDGQVPGCKAAGGDAKPGEGQKLPPGQGDLHERMTPAERAAEERRRADARRTSIDETRRQNCGSDAVCNSCGDKIGAISDNLPGILTNARTSRSQLLTAKADLSIAAQRNDSLTQSVGNARTNVNTVLSKGSDALTEINDAINPSGRGSCAQANTYLSAAAEAYRQAEPVLRDCRSLLATSQEKLGTANSAITGADGHLRPADTGLATEERTLGTVNSECGVTSRLTRVWSARTGQLNDDARNLRAAISDIREFHGKATGQYQIVSRQRGDLNSTCNILQGRLTGNTQKITKVTFNCADTTGWAAKIEELRQANAGAETDMRRDFLDHRDPALTAEGVRTALTPEPAEPASAAGR